MPKNLRIFAEAQCCYKPYSHLSIGFEFRRRIKKEEKAKVVAAIWGTEIIKFLAALAVLHEDDLKNRMNCTRMI